MAIADKTIEPRILASGKEEFLHKGYQEASLKGICGKADVTTGALYKRFSSKGDLFSAVVSPAINDFKRRIQQKSIDTKTLSDQQLIAMWEMTEDAMLWWGEFFYKNQDLFHLLLTKSQGSSYEHFELDVIEWLLPSYCSLYQECYTRGLTKLKVDEMEMRVLVATFWTTILKPIVYRFEWPQLIDHYRIICRLFSWKEALQIVGIEEKGE